jgi:hypothetical protein
MTATGGTSTARRVAATFEGDVISLHVYFAGHQIPMTQSGTKWKGSQSFDVEGTVRAELNFKAPAGTDYTFVLKVDDAKKVDDDGTSAAALFSRGFDVTVP